MGSSQPQTFLAQNISGFFAIADRQPGIHLKLLQRLVIETRRRLCPTSVKEGEDEGSFDDSYECGCSCLSSRKQPQRIGYQGGYPRAPAAAEGAQDEADRSRKLTGIIDCGPNSMQSQKLPRARREGRVWTRFYLEENFLKQLKGDRRMDTDQTNWGAKTSKWDTADGLHRSKPGRQSSEEGFQTGWARKR